MPHWSLSGAHLVMEKLELSATVFANSSADILGVLRVKICEGLGSVSPLSVSLNDSNLGVTVTFVAPFFFLLSSKRDFCFCFGVAHEPSQLFLPLSASFFFLSRVSSLNQNYRHFEKKREFA